MEDVGFRERDPHRREREGGSPDKHQSTRPGGKHRQYGMINQETGTSLNRSLYMKQVNNKDPLYSIGNYIQHLVIL